MDRPPQLRCPQCGHELRGAPASACPECGFFLGPAESRYRGALRYWRFLRLHRRLDILLIGLWLLVLCLTYWVISLAPGTGVVVLTAAAAAGVVGTGHYLRSRRRRRQ